MCYIVGAEGTSGRYCSVVVGAYKDWCSALVGAEGTSRGRTVLYGVMARREQQPSSSLHSFQPLPCLLPALDKGRTAMRCKSAYLN